MRSREFLFPAGCVKAEVFQKNGNGVKNKLCGEIIAKSSSVFVFNHYICNYCQSVAAYFHLEKNIGANQCEPVFIGNADEDSLHPKRGRKKTD